MHIFSFLIYVLSAACIVMPCVSALPDVSDQRNLPSDLIQLEKQQDEVIIGDHITLTGQIDRSLYGTQPSDVIILISAPPGSHANTFMLAKPVPNGTFRYVQIADVGGEWGFEALYSGIYSKKVSVLAIPGDEPKKTALTMSGWPTFPKVGESVTFKGRLTDGEGKGIPHKPIIYRIASSPVGCLGGCAFGGLTEWREAGRVSTDITGEYEFTLTVVETGSVQIEAVFSGDDGYTPSSSQVLKITVYE